MAAQEEKFKHEIGLESAGYKLESQDFGDEPVIGTRAAMVGKKKPVQSSAQGSCKPLDALDELRMLN